MIVQSYESAFAFVAALTQADPISVLIDVRAIHDTLKDVAAIPRRGTLPQVWQEMCRLNNQGYGVFININDMDGQGRELANVHAIRCQAIDLDTLSAEQNYQSATQFNPPPSFAVQSSPGKFHCYWQTLHHRNVDGFTLIQRKLRTLFDGDKRVTDATRVLRLPGFYHLKEPSNPHLVTCWSLAGYGNPIDPALLEQALQHVSVIDGQGERYELGEPKLQAPGWDWCVKALNETDPNDLDRGEWISFTSAWKQAAWNLASEDTLIQHWADWCMRYVVEDGSKPTPAYLRKNWNSVRNTEVGWPSLERRNGNLHAMRLFGEKKAEIERKAHPLSSDVSTAPMPHEQQPQQSQVPQQIPVPTGEFLTDSEQRDYFKGCVFIERMGEILTPSGRFMNSTKFNGTFGGKKFIIDGIGKQTTEAWQAATRSTLYQIPKADHIRFLPSKPYGEIIKDALGRTGVNTYKPAVIDSRQGDITPFIRNMEMMLPWEVDRNILYSYLAHCVKYPGFKIPWAPLIQSVEGVGKGLVKRVMANAVGAPYSYFPNAKELIESGSKFNAWMRSKLFILVDEIMTDERRDMIEILKPMISEETIEIQAKGVDQDIEDNFANWMFFSNFKNAIPVSKNSRRFAIFYSAIQNATDLHDRGMNDQYFADLYNWARAGGDAHVTHWLMNYPIERGDIPMRAPNTTSTFEAVRQSRGPVEVAILDAIGDGLPGFRGGWISSLAVANRLKGTTTRAVSQNTLTAICEVLGYHLIGRAPRPFFAENKDTRADLYCFDRNARVEDFAGWQGYA